MCANKPIIILKIGTTSITKDAENGLNFLVINRLAAVAAALKKQGFKVIIVSSGAMGLGLNKIGQDHIENKIDDVDDCNDNITCFKQALTSVGQIELMKAYENVFKYYDIIVGQVLVTHKGLDDNERNETIKSTLHKLFELEIIPIINANDTVSPVEIVYGDNDSLAARVAILLQASKLIILSDVEGLYDKDPNKNQDAKLITEVSQITDEIKALAGGSNSDSGTGGMRSKVEAAELCLANGVEVNILHSEYIEEIPEILKKPEDVKHASIPYTKFLS